MSDIEAAAAAASAPRTAQCQECGGDGESGEYIGTEMRPVAVPCDTCKGSGKVQVGVFDPVCARHCQFCEGQDHHWSYDGDQDDEGEPLMGCRHCPALREITQDDDANAEY